MVALGETIEEAFHFIYNAQYACEIQVCIHTNAHSLSAAVYPANTRNTQFPNINNFWQRQRDPPVLSLLICFVEGKRALEHTTMTKEDVTTNTYVLHLNKRQYVA